MTPSKQEVKGSDKEEEEGPTEGMSNSRIPRRLLRSSWLVLGPKPAKDAGKGHLFTWPIKVRVLPHIINTSYLHLSIAYCS